MLYPYTYFYLGYVDDLIDLPRRSRFGIHIGNVFIGGICNGLQKLINVFFKYRERCLPSAIRSTSLNASTRTVSACRRVC